MKFHLSTILVFVLTTLALSACMQSTANDQNTIEKDMKDASTVVNQTDSSNIAKNSPSKGQTAYILVNNLRLRQNHDLKSKVIAMLKEGEEVIYLGEVSENEEEVELRGEKKSAPFYRVKTQKGNIGWAYGGALSFKAEAPEVEGYRAVIAFIKENPQAKAEEMANWSQHSSNTLDMARKVGILTSFANEDFHKVLIKDKKANVLDEVNIMRFVRNHAWGIVCVEKGKDPHFIPFNSGMLEAVSEHFGLSADEKAED